MGGGLTVTDISEAHDNSVVTWYDVSTRTQYWYSDCGVIYMNPISSNMFNSMSKHEYLNTIDLSHFNTSKVTTMYSMFYYCRHVTSLDLSHFNTSNVTDMSCMFLYCDSLKSLDLSSFDTSNVTNMMSMFLNGYEYSNSQLTNLDLSSFDTSNVINMGFMFENCSKDPAQSPPITIKYGSKFVNTKLDKRANYGSGGAYFMFYKCGSTNKPNWTNGVWDENGTFIKNS